MFIKLNFNYTESRYEIPTKTDGTRATLPDNHAAVQKMNTINPPHTLNGMRNYPGPIFALSTRDDPFSLRPFDRNMSYWIQV